MGSSLELISADVKKIGGIARGKSQKMIECSYKAEITEHRNSIRIHSGYRSVASGRMYIFTSQKT